MRIGSTTAHVGALAVKYERLLLVAATATLSISASRLAAHPRFSPALLMCIAGGVLLYAADAAREIATLVAQVPSGDEPGERHKIRCELVTKYAPRSLISALVLAIAVGIGGLVYSFYA